MNAFPRVVPTNERVGSKATALEGEEAADEPERRRPAPAARVLQLLEEVVQTLALALAYTERQLGRIEPVLELRDLLLEPPLTAPGHVEVAERGVQLGAGRAVLDARRRCLHEPFEALSMLAQRHDPRSQCRGHTGGAPPPAGNVRVGRLNPARNSHMIRASGGSEASGSRRGVSTWVSDALPIGSRGGWAHRVPHQEGVVHE